MSIKKEEDWDGEELGLRLSRREEEEEEERGFTCEEEEGLYSRLKTTKCLQANEMKPKRRLTSPT